MSAADDSKNRAMTPPILRSYREVVHAHRSILAGSFPLRPEDFVAAIRLYLDIKGARKRFNKKDPTMTDMDLRVLCIEYTEKLYKMQKAR